MYNIVYVIAVKNVKKNSSTFFYILIMRSNVNWYFPRVDWFYETICVARIQVNMKCVENRDSNQTFPDSGFIMVRDRFKCDTIRDIRSV